MSWIGWALLSAIFAAATALLAKVGVQHVDSNLATAIRTTVVVIFAWGIALALGKHGEIRTLDRRTMLFLTLSGLATGLSWLCYFRALQLGPASRVAPLDKLSVPLVMVFAVLTLGEKMDAAAIVGGLVLGTQSNTYVGEAVGTGAVFGGAYAVKSGFDKSAEVKMHNESLKQLGESFEAQVAPMVVDVEGHTLQLKGTAEEQYTEWRRLLKELYENETGMPVQSQAPAAAPAPKKVGG